jgi:hypothetical protein
MWAVGSALTLITVATAVLAAVHLLPGTATSAAPSRPTATATPPAGRTETGPTPTSTPGSGASSALPAGYHPYTAPEGFTVALPSGWKRLATARGADRAYRVTFGAGGDSPTLAVTYSERVGPDPVAVWRDDVEPGLERLGGYHRVGTLKATTYRGHKAADLEWLSGTGDARLHTLGRGFLLDAGRGCSLRFTTPAADWDDAANRLALKTFLETFREPRQ